MYTYKKPILFILVLLLVISLTTFSLFFVKKDKSTERIKSLILELDLTKKEVDICFNEIDEYFSIKRYDLVYSNIDNCRLKINQVISILNNIQTNIQDEDKKRDFQSAIYYIKLISLKLEIIRTVTSITTIDFNNTNNAFIEINSKLEELDSLIEQNRVLINEIYENPSNEALNMSSIFYEKELDYLDKLSSIRSDLKKALA